MFTFQFLNDKIDQNTNFAKHLVCLNFLWRKIFLREWERIFGTCSRPKASFYGKHIRFCKTPLTKTSQAQDVFWKSIMHFKSISFCLNGFCWLDISLFPSFYKIGSYAYGILFQTLFWLIIFEYYVMSHGHGTIFALSIITYHPYCSRVEVGPTVAVFIFSSTD